MLEDNHEFTEKMAHELVETVDLAAVRSEMVRFYHLHHQVRSCFCRNAHWWLL